MNFSFRFLLVPGLLFSLLPLLTGCPLIIASLPAPSLSAEATRATIASQCAQTVIACTTSWPTAAAAVVALEGQTVTEIEDGFMVTGMTELGGFDVQLSGSDSMAGNGAMSLSYSWSTGATDVDPCSLADGEAFSSDEMPLQRMDIGVHYIRLRVENDIIRDVVNTDACGVFGENIPSFDFIEIVVDVRSN